MERISGWGRRQVRRAQVIPGGGVQSHFPGSEMTRLPGDICSSCSFPGRRNRHAHLGAFSPLPSPVPPPPSLSNSSLFPLISHLSADTLPEDREPWQVPPSLPHPPPGLYFRIQKRKWLSPGPRGLCLGQGQGKELGGGGGPCWRSIPCRTECLVGLL